MDGTQWGPSSSSWDQILDDPNLNDEARARLRANIESSRNAPTEHRVEERPVASEARPARTMTDIIREVYERAPDDVNPRATVWGSHADTQLLRDQSQSRARMEAEFNRRVATAGQASYSLRLDTTEFVPIRSPEALRAIEDVYNSLLFVHREFGQISIPEMQQLRSMRPPGTSDVGYQTAIGVIERIFLDARNPNFIRSVALDQVRNRYSIRLHNDETVELSTAVFARAMRPLGIPEYALHERMRLLFCRVGSWLRERSTPQWSYDASETTGGTVTATEVMERVRRFARAEPHGAFYDEPISLQETSQPILQTPNWKKEDSETMELNYQGTPEWLPQHLAMLSRTVGRPIPDPQLFKECKDKREANKIFMESRDHVPEVSINGAQRTALLAFFKNSINLEQINSAIRECDNRARDFFRRFQNEMSAQVQHKERLKFVEAQDMEPLIHEVEEILATGKWELHEVSSVDSFIVFNQKHPTVIRWKDDDKGVDKTVDMGRYQVRVSFRSGRTHAKVYPFMDNRYSSNYYHPHVTSDGDVCWGNASSMITTALANRKLKDVLQTVDLLLHEYNDESPFTGLAGFESSGVREGTVTGEWEYIGEHWVFKDQLGDFRTAVRAVRTDSWTIENGEHSGEDIWKVRLYRQNLTGYLRIGGHESVNLIELNDWEVFVEDDILDNEGLEYSDNANDILSEMGF